MSYDGSSAKSYIRHATEKERLDNLAFASFPEDYLPYAAGPSHQRTTAPPPYLLWGDDRRRRPTKKRRKPKCAGALLCAIALVVVAILAVVAISVYLGVVTNLFRSPVVSVSGRFLASEEFSEELLNSTSSKFLEKADIYQSKVEKAFLSSSLEPAFIAARIYSFRPGLVVFFRVYLDRRKIKQDDGESPPTELVRELVAQRLTSDPESVHIEENEELLSVELRPVEKISSPASSTSKPATTERNGHQRPPASAGVGEWRPVPIEDSVSPSFADRPLSGGGSVRSPAEVPRRNPAEGFGTVRVLEDNLPKKTQSVNNREGIGSVRVLEEPPVINPQSNTREGTGSVRLLEETPLRKSQLVPQSGANSASNTRDSSRNPLLPTDREGVGSIRLLPESPIESSQISNLRPGVGSVRLSDVNPQSASKPSVNSGVAGTVRLLDENPKHSQHPSSREDVSHLRVLNDTPSKKLSAYRNPSVEEGSLRSMEEPPTLAPSVSLVVRNRSRSDKPRNLLTRLEKDQHNSDLARHENVGIGSIKEIITEEGFPLPLLKEPPIFASRLLELSPETTITPNYELKNVTEANKTEDILEATKIPTENISTEVYLKTENENVNYSSENETTTNITTLPSEVPVNETTIKVREKSPLESILFNHPTISSFVTYFKKNFTEEIKTESPTSATDKNSDSTQSLTATTIAESETKDSLKNKVTSVTTQDSDEDIHSNIVNYSQYIFPEPHYHTIENETSTHSDDIFEHHTLEGHGFHKPLNSSVATATKLSTLASTTEFQVTTLMTTSTESQTPTESREILQPLDATSVSPLDDMKNQSKADTTVSSTVSSTFHSLEFTEIYTTTSDSVEKASSGDETANVTTDDTSQQAKVVPQLKNDLLSNDIGEEEESGDENGERFEDEILRHITTLRPQSNGSDISVKPCPSGSIPCNISREGCGVRCDMRRDCPNNEDETGCKCSDLLRAMGQSQKICDSVDDCSDGSDEANCSWCPSTDYYRCPGSRTCVTMDRVCDGKDDCPGAQDERRCVNLAESSAEAESDDYHSEGYLIVRKSGQWGKLCLDTLTQSPDLERRIRDLGKAVCSALTYRNMSTSMRAQDKVESENSYYQISAETVSDRSSSSLFEPTSCKGKEVLRVQCKTLECGLRPSAPPSQRRRIVGGRSADGAGSWPWAAALYREGDFQCGAALISDIWLVSAAHCFYSSQQAHWTARLGVLRRGSELHANGEQVRKIENIILHPQYEDAGFINDIALLKMDRPVPFSDALRPICLPSSPSEDASLWHGRRCSVVGWGKLYEIGHTFPDSLQEVRLPVISSSECQRRSIFLPAYRITPNMFCAGYDRGGRDACLGDSGGPMACHRPADGRWVLLGITSNGDGCGRPNRPGVYSQVAGFLTWIQEKISEEITLDGKAGSESICSKGVRCRLGRCIPSARVCDGRRDCAGGEDEADC